jgi:dUTP pyrophosphatase
MSENIVSEREPEFYLYELEDDLLFNYNKFMRLKIFVDSTDNELKKKYEESIYNHHLKLNQNLNHIDAGFDLLSPDTKIMTSLNVNKLDYKISCSAEIIGRNYTSYNYNTGFYMYPRSSISKSNLRLANNVGIIDAGYRGHLIGMFDVIYADETSVNKFDRHLQICAPDLIPIIVELVETIEDLGEKTARGDGGFGSTGI